MGATHTEQGETPLLEQRQKHPPPSLPPRATDGEEVEPGKEWQEGILRPVLLLIILLCKIIFPKLTLFCL